MAVLNYAEMYLQALQQRFTTSLLFNDLYSTPNNQSIRFSGAKTIHIPRILVGGFVDVNRDAVGGYSRKVDNEYETKTLSHDREFRTLVDPMDIDETNYALSIANITRVFNDEQKIPEMDKYAASKLYQEFLDHGGVADTTALTPDSVMGVFDTMMLALDEAEVPQTGRILYVTAPVNTMLKTAFQAQRLLGQGSNGNINRSVYALDDVKIVVVPSSRMKTVYNFTEGAVVDPTAEQINMILVHPTAVVAPQKYEFVSLDAPSAVTGGKYLYYERKYWDLFLLDTKANAVAFNVSVAPETDPEP